MTDELYYHPHAYLLDPQYRAASDAWASVWMDYLLGIATDAELRAADERLRAERARMAKGATCRS